MTFTEDWFCQQSQDVLAGLVKTVDHLDGNVVEVGCWEGRSTAALANAAYPAKVHAVDTWRGSPGEISSVLAGERNVARTFMDNMVTLTRGNVQMFWMDWRLYFTDHAKPTKFLHIDATHSYDEVRSNIEAALPFMVPGGIVCGDDVHHPPVRAAVTDAFGGFEQDATLWIVRLP